MPFERGSPPRAEGLKDTASPSGSSKKLLIGEPISDISEGEEDETKEGGQFKPRQFSLPTEDIADAGYPGNGSVDGELPVIGDEELEDFEEQEREVARLLESERSEEDEERQPSPSAQPQLGFLTATGGANPHFSSTESLQNRQSSALDLHPDSPASESEAHSLVERRSPSKEETGASFDYSAAPPPSYSTVLENDRAKSARAEARNPRSLSSADGNSDARLPQQHEDSEYESQQPLHPSRSNTDEDSAERVVAEPIEEVPAQSEGGILHTPTEGEMPLESSRHEPQQVEEHRGASVFTPAGGVAEERDSPPPPPIVTEELRELFRLVDESSAEKLDIPVVLKPFLLDYIPAVGDVDPFIKIPRIDGVDDQLGLAVLDEPARQQSDRMVLDMKLRQKQPGTSTADIPVKKLGRVYKNAHQIDKWIASVKEIKKTRPPDRVHYSRPMPDIDRLMQEWNPDIEASLAKAALPSAELNVPLEEYVDICLSLVDIPVHKSRIQSLHTLFSLYSEFKASQHFRNLAANNLYDDEPPPQTNRLEL